MKLCINADDYGLAPGVDDVILELHREGIVTSCSVLACHTDQTSAEKLTAAPTLSTGLHVSLTSGYNNLVKNFSNPFQLALHSRMLCEKQLENEIDTQLLSFCEKLNQKPSHLDTHEHVHVLPEIRRALEKIANREHIVRIRYPREMAQHPGFKARLISSFMPPIPDEVVFFGISLMGKHFSKEKIEKQLDFLLDSGVKKALWMVHPGQNTDHPRDYAYRAHERQILLDSAEMIRKKAELVDMETLG